MAQQPLNIGTGVESGDGDPLRVIFAKISGNLADLDQRLNSSTALIGTLGGAAHLNVGAVTGTVADGGALTAETTRATAAETANTTLINAETSRAQSAEALKAPIASPSFTGVPTAPTATAGTGTTQIATTAFVATAVAAGGGGGGGGGVPTSRQILGGGLATGGGDLTADRTITVPKAAQSDVAAGTDDTKALTSLSVAARLGALAPLASPAFVGTPTAQTAAAGTSTTQIATTAFAQALPFLSYGSVQSLTGSQQAQARANVGLNAAGAAAFRNRLINGNFAINQRGAASASTAYGAGAYAMDRWKAGAAGCTLSFSTAANGDVTVTITAGTLLQVIEGGLYLPEGGIYALSWQGTATARVYQGTATGSYATLPVAATGLIAGTNTTVEFSTGTLTLAQFEPGTQATAFERRDDELRRAQRYFETGNFQLYGGAYAANALASSQIYFKATKRTSNPAVSAALPTYQNLSGVNIVAEGADAALFYSAAAATGNYTGVGTYAANAEL